MLSILVCSIRVFEHPDHSAPESWPKKMQTIKCTGAWYAKDPELPIRGFWVWLIVDQKKKNNVSTWNPLLWNHQNTWDLWIWITPNDSISLVLTPGEWLTSPGSIEWCQFSDVSHYPSQPCQPGCIPIGSSHWVPKILSLFMVQKSKSKKTV